MCQRWINLDSVTLLVGTITMSRNTIVTFARRQLIVHSCSLLNNGTLQSDFLIVHALTHAMTQLSRIAIYELFLCRQCGFKCDESESSTCESMALIRFICCRWCSASEVDPQRATDSAAEAFAGGDEPRNQQENETPPAG
jgi:hypothetical protein